MFRKTLLFVIGATAAFLCLGLLRPGGSDLSIFSRGLVEELWKGFVSTPEPLRREELLLAGTDQETVLHIIDSGVEGPVVMVIGGIHGDEPAGRLAAHKVATWQIDRGILLVLPDANVQATAFQRRYPPGSRDLNRAFPGNPQGDEVARLAAAIYGVMAEFEPDWVLDLHEAREFERVRPGALGQTLIYPYEGSSLDIVKKLLEMLNERVEHPDDTFILLRGSVRGGTIQAARSLGAEGLLVETCLQLPLQRRINYHLAAVYIQLMLLGINVN